MRTHFLSFDALFTELMLSFLRRAAGPETSGAVEAACGFRGAEMLPSVEASGGVRGTYW
jgi:hypothetical protein